MSNLPATIPLNSQTMFFNKYTPLDKIGSGSFGEVWLVTDQTINHNFAIKILKSGIAIDERLKEARIGHAFTHNNLVKVHQADVTTDGRVLIAMDYHPSGAITTLLNAKNFLPLNLGIRSAIDILQGLEHLHQHGLFHNDIKPQNVLLGEDGRALLGDYGIVGISANGAPVAPTACYFNHTAPETHLGMGISEKTDIYQTGLTLFRLIVGVGHLDAIRQKLGDDNAYIALSKSDQLVTKDAFPPYIPKSVSRIILKAISSDPLIRYNSALEMRRDLEKLSFSGFWTFDALGNLCGETLQNTFRFSISNKPSGKQEFVAYRKNRQTGRETKIWKYSFQNLTHIEATKKARAFIEAVIMGKV